jgi:hypothetical protein
MFNRCTQLLRYLPFVSNFERAAQDVASEFVGDIREGSASKKSTSPRRRRHRKPLRRRTNSDRAHGSYEQVSDDQIGAEATDEDDEDALNEIRRLERHFTGPRDFGHLCGVETVELGGTAGGHGVIAIEPIAVGETIFVDRPFLLCPAEYDDHEDADTMERKLWGLLAALLAPEYRAIRDTIEWEVAVNAELLDIVWEPEKDDFDSAATDLGRKAQLGKSAATQCERAKQLYGRLHTNSIMSEPEVQPPWAMIGRRLAMLNHSCSPNAAVVLPKKCTHGCQCPVIKVKAITPIERGDAITILYFSPETAAESRQHRKEGKEEFLKSVYGFECKCQVCTAATVTRGVAAEEAQRAIQRGGDGHCVQQQDSGSRGANLAAYPAAMGSGEKAARLCRGAAPSAKPRVSAAELASRLL